jgi:S-DNA-T family DNA segregation ATPase FtsK/SpoIIIE
MEERQQGAAAQTGSSIAPNLEVIRGENVGETYKVRLTTRIGRERDNDVVILDPKMSRYHAQISMDAGRWMLADLGSSNHTYLNGVAINEPTPLQAGDRISLGETELILKLPGQSVTEPVAAKAASSPIVTPPPVSAQPMREPPPQRVLSSAPPRLAWFAGGFILLLFLIAAAILFIIFNRTQPS